MRFNEARDIAIIKYMEIKKQVTKAEDEDEDKDFLDKDILEMLEEDKEIIEEHEESFICKSSTLVSEWQKTQMQQMKQK